MNSIKRFLQSLLKRKALKKEPNIIEDRLRAERLEELVKEKSFERLRVKRLEEECLEAERLAKDFEATYLKAALNVLKTERVDGERVEAERLDIELLYSPLVDVKLIEAYRLAEQRLRELQLDEPRLKDSPRTSSVRAMSVDEIVERQRRSLEELERQRHRTEELHRRKPDDLSSESTKNKIFTSLSRQRGPRGPLPISSPVNIDEIVRRYCELGIEFAELAALDGREEQIAEALNKIDESRKEIEASSARTRALREETNKLLASIGG